MREELIGEFDFERNIFGRDESRTIIGILADTAGTIVKGRAAEGDLEHGLTYRFYGYWAEHPKYGRQFAFQSFVLSEPAGRRGTICYLQRCHGIGRKRAELIWEEYGPESTKTLREQPEAVAAKIKGLSEDAARGAARYLESVKAIEGVTIELTDLLGRRGFRRTLIGQLIREHGEEAPGMIRENPYFLMRFKNTGFLKTDKLYLELGKPADSIERQARCAWYALHSDSEGHTWYPARFAVSAIRRNVAGTDGIDPRGAIQWAIDNELVAVRQDGRGETWIAEEEKAAAESRLAGFVHRAEVEGAHANTPIQKGTSQ